jgi:membrane-associated phospholipid phosphatase
MYLIRRWRGGLIAVFLILAIAATERRAEPYGDTLQVALPLAALGCSVVSGSAVEFAGRYAAMWVSVRLTKFALDGPMAERPHGGREGFPSAHTSSAAFGASALVLSCLGDAPALKAAIVIAAAFTGTSRVEVRAHDIWQVLAGGIWGVFFERVLRRPGPTRTRVARFFLRRRSA